MPYKIEETDRAEIKEFIRQQWCAPCICIRGKLYYPHEAEGFVVRREGRIVGLVTYQIDGDSLLMLTLNSTEPGAGIGSSLVLSVIEEARRHEVRRIWLITTNDNLKALGFYQRMGFRLVAVHRERRHTGSPDDQA